LLFNTLDRHKAHAQSTHRFAERLGIGRIVLVRFDRSLLTQHWLTPLIERMYLKDIRFNALLCLLYCGAGYAYV
jgi:hypothetical protein